MGLVCAALYVPLLQHRAVATGASREQLGALVATQGCYKCYCGSSGVPLVACAAFDSRSNLMALAATFLAASSARVVRTS